MAAGNVDELLEATTEEHEGSEAVARG